jgi:hypothetical protein
LMRTSGGRTRNGQADAACHSGYGRSVCAMAANAAMVKLVGIPWNTIPYQDESYPASNPSKLSDTRVLSTHVQCIFLGVHPSKYVYYLFWFR